MDNKSDALRRAADVRRSLVFAIAGICILAFALWFRGAESTLFSRSPFPGTPSTGVSSAYLVFSPQDCSSQLNVLAAWNSVHDANQVRVVGLVYGNVEKNSIAKIIRGAGLRFPIHQPSRRVLNRLRASLGYSEGSFIVLTDGQDRVRRVLPLEGMKRTEVSLVLAELLNLKKDP